MCLDIPCANSNLLKGEHSMNFHGLSTIKPFFRLILEIPGFLKTLLEKAKKTAELQMLSCFSMFFMNIYEIFKVSFITDFLGFLLLFEN